MPCVASTSTCEPARVHRGGRGVGLGQVGDDARGPRPAAAHSQDHGSVKFRGDELVGRKPKQLQQVRGQQDLDYLPGSAHRG